MGPPLDDDAGEGAFGVSDIIFGVALLIRLAGGFGTGFGNNSVFHNVAGLHRFRSVMFAP